MVSLTPNGVDWCWASRPFRVRYNMDFDKCFSLPFYGPFGIKGINVLMSLIFFLSGEWEMLLSR